jgi:anti-sigma-K factor RskA
MSTPLPPTDQTEARDAWASEYVLGTLPAAQRRALEAALPTDADLAARVAAWEQRLQPLTGLSDPVEPPARLWQRIEDTLGWVAPAARSGSWWHSLALWRGLTAASLTAAVVMAAVLVQTPPPVAPSHLVVLVAPQDKAPGWVIQASGQRQLQLIPLGVFEVPADKALEFWTKADDWSGPVSLGLVKPGQRLEVPLDRLPPLQPNQLFELTLEPPTGSPTGKPTGPIQFIGRAVPVM